MISKTCGVPVRMSILPAKTRGITKSPKGGIQPKSTRIFKIGENGHKNRGKSLEFTRSGEFGGGSLWWWTPKLRIFTKQNVERHDEIYCESEKGSRKLFDIFWEYVAFAHWWIAIALNFVANCACVCVSTLESGSRLRNPFSLHNYQNSRQVQVGLLLLTSLLGNLQ